MYAVAGYPMQDELGWRESRLKIYTTDPGQRQTLLDQNWRDNGVVFYVPSVPSVSTQTIYSSQVSAGWNCTECNAIQHRQYYFTAVDMASHATDTSPPTPAFEVLTSAAAGTAPLNSVLYSSETSPRGANGRTRAFQPGVEPRGRPAMASGVGGNHRADNVGRRGARLGVPFQGFLSAQHLEAPPHQTFYTLSDLQAASPTGEVFINGEYDNVPASPIPIARSFVAVAPQPHSPSDWDWYQGFSVGTSLGPVTMLDFQGSQTHFSCTWEGCMAQDSVFQVDAYELDEPNGIAVLTWGQFQGQLWEAFDDTGQDVTGRVRFSADYKPPRSRRRRSFTSRCP